MAPKKIITITTNVQKTCSYCGALVSLLPGTRLYVCVNESCYKKVSEQAYNWLLAIDHVGDFTEEFLFRLAQTGTIKSIVDLYKISLHDIADSLLEQTTSLISNKLYMTIQTSVGNMTVGQFLIGLQIPLCSEKVCSKLAKKIVSCDEIFKTFEGKEAQQFLGADHQEVMKWLRNKASFIEELFAKARPKTEVYSCGELKLQDINICITGLLKHPREQFVELIKQNGGNFHLRLIRKTKYVLVGSTPEENVLEKAKKYKTKLLTEDQFWKMLD